MTKKPKPKQKCTNCGDEFVMTGNAVGERVKRGWCGGCWRQYVASHRETSKGEDWIDRRPDGTARGYSSRPEYDA